MESIRLDRERRFSTRWKVSGDRKPPLNRRTYSHIQLTKSQSYLDILDSTARFHGNLDIATLGGAGFASQSTNTGSDRSWDLSSYDGIQLKLEKSDGRRYTFILKDEVLPKDPETRREQATISYEYDFVAPGAFVGECSSISVPWRDFTPTYRGKGKKNAPALNKKSVKQFSIMMRRYTNRSVLNNKGVMLIKASFFGDQEGDFSLTIKSIKAVSLPEELEKGFPSKSTLACVLGIGLASYGIYILLCPWVIRAYLT